MCFKNSALELKKLKTILILALLVALNIVLDHFTIIVSDSLHITFKFLTHAASGMLFGPVAGMLEGAVADFFGYLLYPKGPYFPGFMFSAMTTGLLFGLFFYQKKCTLPKIIGCRLLNIVLVNIVMDSLWLYVLYHNGVIAQIPARIVKSLVELPFDVVIIFGMGKALERVKKARLLE